MSTYLSIMYVISCLRTYHNACHFVSTHLSIMHVISCLHTYHNACHFMSTYLSIMHAISHGSTMDLKISIISHLDSK